MPRLNGRTLGLLALFALCCVATTLHASTPAPTPESLGSDSDNLYLRSGTYRLAGEQSLLNRQTANFDSDIHYLIHLDGPMTPHRRAAIGAAGIQLGEYLPMNSYVAKLADVPVQSVQSLNFITFVGEYQIEWKLDPEIAGDKPYETDERIQLQQAGRKRLDLALFAGADMAAALQALDAAGAIILDVQPRDTDCTIELEIEVGAVEGLASIPQVRFIAEAPEGVPRNSSSAWIAQSNVTNFRPLYDAGLHGENEIVGLIDWDLDENHCSFSDVIPPGPAHRKIIDYFGNNAIPGTFGYHGTFTGCILAGDELAGSNPDFKGMAYAAKMVMQHYTSAITTTNLLSRLDYAHNLGARLHSNSWGSSSSNAYNSWCHDIDQFTHDNEDDLVVFAILNGSVSSPAGSILSPENSKNCLATAACGDTPNQENHGSGARGPTTDNRQKPELWFPGCPDSANVSTACSVINRGCATSWSAPNATGNAALVRQYFMEGRYPTGIATPADAFTPSGALIKAMLINSAVDMSGFAGYYGTHEGYGRVLLDQSVYLSGDARRTIVWDVRNADGLSTEQSDVLTFNVDSSVEKLKIALVWSDASAAIGAAFAPVNNLNLVVTSPASSTYFGNVFSGAESVTGGAPDPRNNTEVVLKSNPTPGEWTVQVVGSSVSVGAQGYALVVSGAVSEIPTCVKGDMNDDGLFDAADVSTFVDVLLNGGTAREICAGDINESGTVTVDDVGPFAALLVGVAYCPRMKGDLNGDSIVDGRDIQGFATMLTLGGTPDEICAGDINQSGQTDLVDVDAMTRLLIQFF